MKKKKSSKTKSVCCLFANKCDQVSYNNLPVSKVDTSYFETFADLSERDCSQSESGCDCLQTGCLPPGDQRLRMFNHQTLGNQLFAAATGNPTVNKSTQPPASVNLTENSRSN